MIVIATTFHMLEILDSRDCHNGVVKPSLPTVCKSTCSFDKYLLAPVTIFLSAIKGLTSSLTFFRNEE